MDRSRFGHPDRSVPPGSEVDVPRLQSWIDDNLADLGSITGATRFAGGKANLTYLLELTGGAHDSAVLRRPPAGPLPKGGHDMSREAFVLDRLWSGFPLAPRALAYCDNPTVIGAPFVLLERKEGIVVQGSVPTEFGGGQDTTLNHAMARTVVATLADFHAVDATEVGLGDLGRPNGFLRRQLDGWESRMIRAAFDDQVAVTRVFEWLRESMPQSRRVTLVHNDWRLDNLALDPADPSVCTAVFDWDMCTRGDPMADLGTLLATWYDADERIDEFAPMPTHVPGFLNRNTAVKLYADLTGHDASDANWYLVFGTMKMAAILQQIHRRLSDSDESAELHSAMGSAAMKMVGLAQSRRSY